MTQLSHVLKVAIAKENLEEAEIPPLTAEEELMVAPPDEADEIVDEPTGEDDVASLPDDIAALTQAEDAATLVVNEVKEAGEDITPEAVVIASERLARIFGRVGLGNRTFSRESFKNPEAPQQPDENEIVEENRPGPYDAAQDLIEDAEKNLEFIKMASNEGLKEFVNRIAVNSKNFFRWSDTYAKKVKATAAKARKTEGSLPSDAVYKNRVRIAHFTNADKKVLTTAAEYGKAVEHSSSAIKALLPFQTKLANAFRLFSKPNGSFDFSGILDGFPEVTVDGETGYAVSGGDGIFGEESIITGLEVGKVEDWAGMADVVRALDVSQEDYWTVRSLGDALQAPMMSAAEVAKNCDALVKLAQELVGDYATLAKFSQTSSSSQGNDNIWQIASGIVLDAAANRHMIGVRRQVDMLVASIVQAAEHSIDIKAKGLNCLLDYYEASLAAHSTKNDGEKKT